MGGGALATPEALCRSQIALDVALQGGGVKRPDLAGRFLATMKQKQTRDAADVVACCGYRSSFGVNFDEHQSVQIVARCAFKHRAEDTAGGASRGPEIHQYRDVAAFDYAPETAVIERNRDRAEQRFFAAPAAGRGTQTILWQAVQLAAVRADGKCGVHVD